MTLNDLENLTGMTRSPITKALSWLLGENEHGLRVLEREQVDRTYVYRPRIRMSRVSRLSEKEESSKSTLEALESRVSRLSEGESLSESDRELIKYINSLNSLSDSSSLTVDESLVSRLSLLKELRAAGVFLKTAQGLVEDYHEDRIRQKMAYFEHALQMGFAKNPGWLVAAIKENFPAPLGYGQKPVKDNPPPMSVVQICPDCSRYPCDCDAVCGQCLQDPCVCPAPPDPPVGGDYEGPKRITRAWEAAKVQLRIEMPKATFETWVDPTWLSAYDDDAQVVVIGAQNEYARQWLEDRLSSQLQRLLTGILGQSVSVRFESPPGPQRGE